MATRKEERYYYADGERIELTPSQQFVAVRPTAGSDGIKAVAESLDYPGQVLTLDDRDLVVVCTSDEVDTPSGVTSPTFNSVTSRVKSTKAMVAGPTVFEVAGAGLLGMIPTGEIIIKFDEGVGSERRAELLAEVGATVERDEYPEPGAVLASVADEDAAFDVTAALFANPEIEYAEPEFIQVSRKPDAVNTLMMNGLTEDIVDLDEMTAEAIKPVITAVPLVPPNDPGYASQWGLSKIEAPAAWEISSGDASLKVAVIDEGCDIGHEDIGFHLPGYDAFDGDDNPTPSGNDAHGTAVAGIVAMQKDNGRGGVGVAPGCRVMPIRIAKGLPNGFWQTSSAKVADGIRTAVARGADVLSNSYRLAPSSAVTSALQFAATSGRGGKGTPSAVASANDDVGTVAYPARLSSSVPGLMAVGASNEWDQRKSKASLDGEDWWGSNWGPELDILAPGVHVYTSDISGSAGYRGSNYITNFNGTSSATPHVAGVMGLILSVDPELRAWEVEDIIKMSADDLGAPGRDDQTGYGRLNARTALEAAKRVWHQINVKPTFMGNQACFRTRARLFNSGINRVRINSFTLKSHSDDWSQVIDRFEYRPDPGGIMLPRSGQDLVFDRILLKANGDRRRWSYRWSASWTYTFWRPTAPGFPMAANAGMPAGQAGVAEPILGGDAGAMTDELAGAPNPTEATEAGDLVAIDRDTRTITITVR